MKLKAILLSTVLISAPALAAGDPGELAVLAPQGEAVVINGKTFYKNTPKAFLLFRLFGSEEAPKVYAGEILTDATGLVTHKTSGLILVKADKAAAESLAKVNNLSLISNAGGVVVLKAASGAELTELVSNLEDQGLKAQLEVFSETKKPE
ncbi:hypothetical protein [Grimontia sp. NTOU-MAR1]|uniref:hypothetical protein n=1 Tax=Grimontia sp. NTOU-MAR1 TaxID=3111011 RepID=UPI002DBF0E99|nr:hypothetical protein [Grimontia sp. NTOU-MAR1]WRW00825.1 hypothetical protein VP504_20485 [Grimontia sp. NTOU-MAR1]